MDTCAGSHNDRHAEIAHTEGSNSCPLCEVKIELEKASGERDLFKEELVTVREERESLAAELADLKKRLEEKGITWVVEPVKEASQ